MCWFHSATGNLPISCMHLEVYSMEKHAVKRSLLTLHEFACVLGHLSGLIIAHKCVGREHYR